MRVRRKLRTSLILIDALEPRQFLSVSSPSISAAMKNGPTTNRIDLSIVGDGFTSSQLSTFQNEVGTFVGDFFDEAPLSSYRSFFNVFQVDVVSNVSGVSNDPNMGIARVTPLNMAYWTDGIERLLGVDTSQAKAYASLAPADDQTIVIANSSKYGGAGYPGQDVLTYAGGNASAIEIVRHEFGHSFAGLADEYDYGGPTVYSGSEPSEPDVSTYTTSEMLAKKVKWWRWIGTDGVGTYEGADYSQQGIYRPTYDSKMRTLGVGYGPVDTEQLIENMYEKVAPIDSATAAGTYAAQSKFSVTPVEPSDHKDTVQWYLDGKAIAGATGTSFSAGSVSIPSGNHTLSVKVADPTTAVRDETFRAKYMTASRQWTITVAGASVNGQVYNDAGGVGYRTSSDASLTNVRVYIDGNKNGHFDAGEKSTLTNSTGTYGFTGLAAGHYRVRVVNPAGTRVTTPASGYWEIVLTTGQTISHDKFGLTHLAAVSGNVFTDANSNATLDAGEMGLSAWRVFIDANNDGMFESTERSVLTDSAGKFTLGSITAGTHTLGIVVMTGWSPTSKTTLTLQFAAGQIITGRNFGVRKVTPS